MDNKTYLDKLGMIANWAMIKRIELPPTSPYHVEDPNGYLMLTEIYERPAKCPMCKQVKDKSVRISYRRVASTWHYWCDRCPSRRNLPVKKSTNQCSD